jgi:uncharacterized membrane protein
MLTSSWPEIALTAASFSILLVYHIHLFYQVRNSPMSTSIGLTNHLRHDWVEAVMKGKQGILSVQTLRNWVMASSFLASAAILIGLGILNATFHTDKIAECTKALNMFGARNEAVWLIKLMVLAIAFFFAFFNFALSIRYYNHAGFAINVSPADDPIVTHDAVTKIVNRATTHYTLGMRGYYVAVPFSLWLFGPSWMLIGAVVLTIVLYKLDRTI